ncbi:MAG TPA: SsrA-binding protein SmpB [Candidatus Coprovivens excrementavium]|nr:SsrA-binding protein SmpB [Candidatus Coprovivens excrementavium]
MEIQNKKANFDYFIEETIECGIELKGTEIKSLRKGSADLRDTFALIRNGEVYLVNMYIAKYEEGNRFNHQERRTRKLLLHKREIRKLKEKIEREGYSLVPVKAYFVNNKFKILLGIGKGKKLYDKRETIKERDLKRESQRMR